ncbi:Uncharacterized protein OBRU01_12018, partial [Operophtera brumata]
LKMHKLLFHLLGAIQFAYGCYYDCTYVIIPSTSSVVPSFGGKLKYLTFINAMIQTAYFTLAALNDLIGSNEPSPRDKPLIRRVKDLVFSSLAFPVSIFVGVTFWALYAVDRELILPRSLDDYFPTWLNHVMHTNIVLFILIELATSFRMYPLRKFGLSILCTFMLCYVVWVHVIWFRTGMWVYPVLKVFNWPLRIAFYGFSLSFVCTFYSLGERLNAAIWSKEVEETVKSGKKKAK